MQTSCIEPSTEYITCTLQIQQLARFEDDLESNRAMRDQGGGSPQLEQDITRLEKIVEILSQDKFCYEAQILRVCS